MSLYMSNVFPALQFSELISLSRYMKPGWVWVAAGREVGQLLITPNWTVLVPSKLHLSEDFQAGFLTEFKNTK